jgi:hypothetical protein
MPKANRMTELLQIAQSVMREKRWLEAIKLLKENSSVVEKGLRRLKRRTLVA